MKADETARLFIGMGSNLGNSAETLLMAWETLDQDPGIHCVALSSPYVSAPVDMHSQHWFTNAVGELRSSLTPLQFLEKLMDVETDLGRVRDRQAFGYQDRTIDLDLLYYGDLELDEPDLILPHPHLHNRLFVLSPLAEIAPKFVDCQRGRAVRELEADLLERMAEGKERRQEIRKTAWPQ
jgi:2-amino-4-hydroxy-6-hydroxymethyldihydropteridine diphosphokinase